MVTLSNTVTTTQEDSWGNVLTTSAVITDTSGKEYKTETNWYGESLMVLESQPNVLLLSRFIFIYRDASLRSFKLFKVTKTAQIH